jgi:hypothetical protein
LKKIARIRPESAGEPTDARAEKVTFAFRTARMAAVSTEIQTFADFSSYTDCEVFQSAYLVKRPFFPTFPKYRELDKSRLFRITQNPV